MSVVEPYREKKDEQNPNFSDLIADSKIAGSKMKMHIIKIKDVDKYAVLEFELEKNTRYKQFSFKKYHRYGDENFFGDRPGIYLFQQQDDHIKVGESRNLSQRLRTHRKIIKENGKGLIIFYCEEGKKWPEDPLNNDVMRLTIERILQANFPTASSRTEKWVTPSEDVFEEAHNICKELIKIKGKKSWLKWKVLLLPSHPK